MTKLMVFDNIKLSTIIHHHAQKSHVQKTHVSCEKFSECHKAFLVNLTTLSVDSALRLPLHIYYTPVNWFHAKTAYII